MDILQQFGIEPLLLVAQLVNFLILAYILKRFLYKPILSVIKKREEKIKSGLADAAAAEQALKKAHDQEKEILSKANKEAKDLLAEMKKQGDEVILQAREKAKEDAQQLVTEAKRQMDEDMTKREKELEKKVVVIATSLLERILPEVLTKEDQVKVIKATQKQLEKSV